MRVRTITEELQIQCLALFGSIWQVPAGQGSSNYWIRVWDWLRTHHVHLCKEPDVDYPTARSRDIELLNQIWDWQDHRRPKKANRGSYEKW